LGQLECAICQQELLQWACSCGTVETFHQTDGYWFPHPIEHLEQSTPSEVSVITTNNAYK
ncbi:MAG: hypothetical protein L0154_15915, partial [Chloroflexi bacterium]|nr:hypothetical protein [Chloroflexota bacterium]